MTVRGQNRPYGAITSWQNLLFLKGTLEVRPKVIGSNTPVLQGLVLQQDKVT